MAARRLALATALVVGGAAACGGVALEQAPDASSDSPAPDASSIDAPRIDAGGASSGVTLWSGGCPAGLAVDETRVYWADPGAGEIFAMPKAGGSPTVLATAQDRPSGIAVSDGYVYWTNSGEPAEAGFNPTGNGTVKKVAAGGGPVATLAADLVSPRALTVQGAGVFFTTAWFNIAVVPIDGGFVGADTGFAPYARVYGQGGLQGIASNGVVALAGPRLTIFSVEGASISGPRLGGLVVESSHALRGVAIDGEQSFRTDGSQVVSLLVTAPDASAISGPGSLDPGTILAEDATGPEGIALDAAYVYWTDTGTATNGFTDGSVRRVPRTGGATEVLSGGELRPVAVVVDDAFVYWSNAGSPESCEGGAIRRAVK